MRLVILSVALLAAASLSFLGAGDAPAKKVNFRLKDAGGRSWDLSEI